MPSTSRVKPKRPTEFAVVGSAILLFHFWETFLKNMAAPLKFSFTSKTMYTRIWFKENHANDKLFFITMLQYLFDFRLKDLKHLAEDKLKNSYNIVTVQYILPDDMSAIFFSGQTHSI